MTAELLPCPFCGSKPYLGKAKGRYYIQCRGHFQDPYGYVQIYGESKWDAVERWNRRPDTKVENLQQTTNNARDEICPHRDTWTLIDRDGSVMYKILACIKGGRGE